MFDLFPTTKFDVNSENGNSSGYKAVQRHAVCCKQRKSTFLIVLCDDYYADFLMESKCGRNYLIAMAGSTD